MFEVCGVLLEDFGSGVVGEDDEEGEGKFVGVGEGEGVFVGAGELDKDGAGDSVEEAEGKGDGEEVSGGVIVGKPNVCRGAAPPAAMLALSE